MTLHELTTNAIKHGALSVPDGAITVEWSGGGGAPLVLRWSEKGGPPVSAPRSSGIGLDAINCIAADQLGGSARFDWRPEGLVCDVIVPPDKLVSEGA
jgi:two-component sensor histidine kinase